MKKGFTLVELLCVIVIISAVTMITIPIVNTQIIAARDSLYKSQLNDIEAATKKFATEYREYIDKNHVNATYVSLSILQSLNYLEKGKIIDPKTKDEMKGCILINYDITKKSYNYTYNEDACTTYASENEELIDAYVIYDSVEAKKPVKNAASKEQNSIANEIIQFYENLDGHTTIHADGESGDGLYSLDDKYVFRGSSVNNYVTYAGSNWRIISIDKETNNMKLINTTGTAALWGDSINFYETEYYINNSEKYKNYKIDLNNSWNANKVDDSAKSRELIRQEIKSTNKVESTLNFGLLSIIDYIDASTNSNCASDFKNSGCGENNYIRNMLNGNSTWLINKSNENNIWYINESGIVKNKLITEGSTYYKYPVIVLDSSVYNSSNNATGSQENPYILK